jgi:DNA ligase 1
MSSTDDLYRALVRCSLTTSKKEKLAIVQTLGEHTRWLSLALDPRLPYFFSADTFPSLQDESAVTRCLNDGDALLLHDLSTRAITGNDAVAVVRETLQELTPESQEVFKRIILKDLRCGVGVTIVNQAFPGLVFDPPYMRCCLPKDSNMSKWNWADGIYEQLKADGMFANVDIDGEGVLIVSSRQGVPFPPEALGRLEDELLATLNSGTRTMGELTVYNGDQLLERQEGNGILNSVAQGGELAANHWVRFDAWDQIPLSAAVTKGTYEVPYKTRLDELYRQVGLASPQNQVHVIETAVVYSKADAMKIYRAYLARKLEGVICKHPDAIWKDGDNKDQVKLKLEVVVDLRIKGFRPGTPGKRTEATFGAVICGTEDDLLEVGVSGFKRDMEQYLHEHRDEVLGGVMAVKANGVMEPTGEASIFSLFSPRFAELRRDKKEADTLQQVVDQFEAAVAA